MISPWEIKIGAHREVLGGGPSEWNLRGTAQLDFLLDMGLQRHSRVLDVGCGPLRAGIPLIRYLNDGCYTGFDYNQCFIDGGRHEVKINYLEDKHPSLHTIKDFNCSGLGQFDFIIVFSVLQHYVLDQWKYFFETASTVSIPSTRLYISHCNQKLEASGFKITKRLHEHKAFSDGWKYSVEKPFPIYEFSR